MPIAARKAWIDAEAAAGVREIEVGSFVPAKLLPQLEGTAEVVAHARTITGLTVAALVPNARGARDAIAAGAPTTTLPLPLSQTHRTDSPRARKAWVSYVSYRGWPRHI